MRVNVPTPAPASGSEVTGSPGASVTPEPIMRLASGFMAAKHLFAADELGLFEALAEGPATLDALAARTGLSPRAARISADAMVALGLLVRVGDRYGNSPTADTFLTGRTPADLRPFLRFWDQVSYPAWCGLADALARGPAQQIFDLGDDLLEIAAAGIEAVLVGPASALPERFDFSAHRRLLDIGGGTGSWSIAVARRYPHLQATVLELAPVAKVARDRVAKAELSSRIVVTVGDAMSEPPPPGHDVFLIANLLHYWSPTDNEALLRRVRGSAEAGSHLLLADFWTDPTHTQPLQAALMAGEFAVHLRGGDVYSVEEVRDWFTRTGWRFIDHIPLAGPQSLVVAQAEV
ncbi:methyltransferase [Blastococcus deserti]|uniref:Methyltransferase n=1 Tax=Blastococcus deserti TaxID=2259033 RepID=A0ABW4XBU7_9ACTN